MVGFWDGNGISWAICKQSAPRSRQTTTPKPHRSIFTGWKLFVTPNQQCQSTEGSVDQCYLSYGFSVSVSVTVMYFPVKNSCSYIGFQFLFQLMHFKVSVTVL